MHTAVPVCFSFRSFESFSHICTTKGLSLSFVLKVSVNLLISNSVPVLFCSGRLLAPFLDSLLHIKPHLSLYVSISVSLFSLSLPLSLSLFLCFSLPVCLSCHPLLLDSSPPIHCHSLCFSLSCLKMSFHAFFSKCCPFTCIFNQLHFPVLRPSPSLPTHFPSRFRFLLNQSSILPFLPLVILIFSSLSAMSLSPSLPTSAPSKFLCPIH